jgi:hypothetical protein
MLAQGRKLEGARSMESGDHDLFNALSLVLWFSGLLAAAHGVATPPAIRARYSGCRRGSDPTRESHGQFLRQ